MKLLIIGDVHGRDFWRNPVKENIDKVDKIVFLGDYLDPYDDEGVEYDFDDAIESMKEIIELKKNNMEKVVLLLGNHDSHYKWQLYCDLAQSTRYRSYYAYKVRDILSENSDLFQVCFSVDINGKKVIFTHAGITKHWAKKCDIVLDDGIDEKINKMMDSDDGIRNLAVVGEYRTWYGGDKTGSPQWCDIREFYKNDNEEFDKDCIQIFGHTRLDKGKMIHFKNCYCLDNQTAYILDDELNLTEVS